MKVYMNEVRRRKGEKENREDECFCIVYLLRLLCMISFTYFRFNNLLK